MALSISELDRNVIRLKAVPFCDGLNADELTVIAGQLHERPFAAGETLASAGDDVTEFWIVVEGELDSFVTDARGQEHLLGTVRQGETVGEVMILEKTAKSQVRFEARTGGMLLAAPAVLLFDWVEAYPRLMRNLFRTLSGRFKQVAGLAPRGIASRRLGIVAGSPRGSVLIGRLASRLLSLDERLQVWADRPALLRSTRTWPKDLIVDELATIGDALRQPSSYSTRRIVIRAADTVERIDIEQLRECDEVLWLVEPREAEAELNILSRCCALHPEFAQRARIVWLLDAGNPVAPLYSGVELTKADLKVPVESNDENPTRVERQGLDRLVRALRGISIGIALAGGGAKGMAHLGVLRVLEAAALSFDAMSGTSAGALAGILYASGMAPEAAIESFQRDLTPSRLFQMLPKWPNWYLVAQFRNRKWDAMLRRYLHDWRLEQLPIPFSAVATDLVQARTVVRSRGDAVHAILESINLPVISRPILRDGMALVDGGVLNNLPADVLAGNGVDFVVGIDVSSRVSREFAGNRPDMPTDMMKDVGSIDALLRIFESQAHSIGKLRNRAVDFWIRPDTSGFGLAEFHRTTEIAAVGDAAAKASVTELKRRLVELEQRLFGLPERAKAAR